VYCKLRKIPCTLAPWRDAAIRNQLKFTRRFALVVLLALSPASADASELRPEAAQGFDHYVQLTERRMQSELSTGSAFLWVDSLAEPHRSEAYALLQRGEVLAAKLQTADPSGRSYTPGALIHHWVGTIFIPGVSLPQVLAVVQDYDRHAEYYKPDVMDSKKVAQSGDDFKVHYRLRKKKIITIILDADYDVHRHLLDATHAYSNSVSTRIAQVENAGQPNERELPVGNDGGYLWRLNSYWRYFDSGRGVFVQCEAISLTRDVPAAVSWLVGSFVQTVPRESLEFTLQSTRNAVLRGASHSGQ
jgi:hypothetical protein